MTKSILYFIRFNMMMAKFAFELSLKVGVIKVLALPHIHENTLTKVAESKKFKDYVSKI